MVSNARDDLPEPLNPVKTTRRLRGISTSMFFRLCCRAPRTTILSGSKSDVLPRCPVYPHAPFPRGGQPPRGPAHGFTYKSTTNGRGPTRRARTHQEGEDPPEDEEPPEGGDPQGGREPTRRARPRPMEWAQRSAL